MRKISAHYIINPGQEPVRNGIIEVSDEGTILNLRPGDPEREEARVEFYNGVVVPGFVNVHTHLELCGLHKLIPQKTGISGFIDQVVSKRKSLQQNNPDIRRHMDVMYLQGTQFAGDICNGSDTLEAKKSSRLQTHSFIELFGLNGTQAQDIWEKGLELRQQFLAAGQPASLTPHAPYSLSDPLWELFRQHKQWCEPVSIHHMESLEEEQLFASQSGPLAERLRLTTSDSIIPRPATSSTQWISQQLPESEKVLLIHNTFASFEEMQKLIKQHPQKQFYFGLCPNANLYIENALPTTMIDQRKEFKLCIGTDSLASNHHLSILEELRTLSAAFPEVSLGEWIEMACLNGAKVFGLENRLGSFEPGKQPGVLLLEHLNLNQLVITPETRVKRIV